jgi:hypothetical protein
LSGGQIARQLAAALVLAVVQPARAALAEEFSTGIAADRFAPGIGPAVLGSTEGADVTRRGQTSAVLSLSYERDPVRLIGRLTGATVSEPVRGQLAADLSVEFGVLRGLAVAVGLPVVMWNDGDRLRGTGVDERTLTAAVGDLRLRGKATLIGQPTRPGLHAAVVLQVTVPMGGQSQFAGTSTPTIEPRLVADYRLGRFALAAMVGVRFEGARSLFSTDFGDELTWSAGPIVRLYSRGDSHLSLYAEAAGAVGQGDGTRPVEVRGAVRLTRPRWMFDLGGGGGVNHDFASPSFRVLGIVRTRIGAD